MICKHTLRKKGETKQNKTKQTPAKSLLFRTENEMKTCRQKIKDVSLQDCLTRNIKENSLIMFLVQLLSKPGRTVFGNVGEREILSLKE